MKLDEIIKQQQKFVRDLTLRNPHLARTEGEGQWRFIHDVNRAAAIRAIAKEIRAAEPADIDPEYDEAYKDGYHQGIAAAYRSIAERLGIELERETTSNEK